MASTENNDSPSAQLGRILIVEDDALVAMSLAEALRDAGAEVATCPSIAEALAELERLLPDTLVLDVHLADRDDGWALAELALQLSPQPPLIVFSTGLPESIPPEIAQKGHVLAKPFATEDLVALVREHRQRPGVFARLRDAFSP